MHLCELVRNNAEIWRNLQQRYCSKLRSNECYTDSNRHTYSKIFFKQIFTLLASVEGCRKIDRPMNWILKSIQ